MRNSAAYKNWLATAATNGAVVLWDLNMTDLKKTGMSSVRTLYR